MLGREPVLWMALVQAAIAMAVGFGLNWTGEQVSMVTAFAAAVLAFVARSQVTPNQTAEAAIQKTASTGVAQSLKAILVIVLIGAMAACSSKQLDIALEAENQVHEGLKRSREAIVTVCPPENLSQMCSTAKSSFNEVLDAAIAYNRGLRTKDLSQGALLVQAIERFVERIKEFKELGGVVSNVTFAKDGVKQ